MDIEEKVYQLLRPVIEESGYCLCEVSYLKEGSLYFLRVIIDHKEGISVEDCVTVSKLISPILDENDPIDDNYILDVCSKEEGCE